MKCPKCNQSLVMSERQGVEIDYCPECRGVWLDRGELVPDALADQVLHGGAKGLGLLMAGVHPEPVPA